MLQQSTLNKKAWSGYQHSDYTDGVWRCSPVPYMHSCAQWCPHQATKPTDSRELC